MLETGSVLHYCFHFISWQVKIQGKLLFIKWLFQQRSQTGKQSTLNHTSERSIGVFRLCNWGSSKTSVFSKWFRVKPNLHIVKQKDKSSFSCMCFSQSEVSLPIFEKDLRKWYCWPHKTLMSFLNKSVLHQTKPCWHILSERVCLVEFHS